jgi:peptide/nickel transport system substrate-binding protein/oligopeptide transport system substrate-binding protein
MSAAIEEYGECDEDGYVSNPGHQVYTGTMMYTQYLVFNVENDVIKDEKVRRALSVAINRQAICDTIYEGSATPASDIIPQAIAGSQEGTWATDYDPELAAQLLDEAGYPADADGKRGLSIELMTNAANAKEEYEAMISDWGAVGIDATMNRVEYATMLENYLSGSFQVAARGWYADYPIADNYLYPLFDSASSDNMSHFSDPTFDEMITKARAVVDDQARVEAMRECDEYVAAIMPIAPLNWKAISRCSTARCNDFQITPGIQPIMARMWLSE